MSLEFQKEGRENRAEEIFEETVTPSRTNTHTFQVTKSKGQQGENLKGSQRKEKEKENIYHTSLQNLCKL